MLYISSFLTNDVNKAVCKVTGKHLNRGAGMGLEVPCMYKFARQESSIESLRTANSSLIYRPDNEVNKSNKFPPNFNFLYLQQHLNKNLRNKYKNINLLIFKTNTVFTLYLSKFT